ncbi:hypothetical protein GCM10017655_16340 [Pseudomonas turukhanskensis]|uniref:Type II toxin-antitoxin system RelE/ParE family toxin n=1 Tax=Pseudomonas turukhanskensis TaxID=1806536 RepID=A0A9W6NF82_9PSED|nr:hypothetical protein GCM10017655_16340 [Pseudomonas turukhanskensis]
MMRGLRGSLSGVAGCVIKASLMQRPAARIHGRRTEEPDKIGKALRGPLAGCRRIRLGDIRIVYRINGTEIVVGGV